MGCEEQDCRTCKRRIESVIMGLDTNIHELVEVKCYDPMLKRWTIFMNKCSSDGYFRDNDSLQRWITHRWGIKLGDDDSCIFYADDLIALKMDCELAIDLFRESGIESKIHAILHNNDEIVEILNVINRIIGITEGSDEKQVIKMWKEANKKYILVNCG